MNTDDDGLAAKINDDRRRELAIEHLLFGTIRFVAAKYPGLVEELEQSLSHLGDRAEGPDKDDEAVREIARRFLSSLKRSAGG